MSKKKQLRKEIERLRIELADEAARHQMDNRAAKRIEENLRHRLEMIGLKTQTTDTPPDPVQLVSAEMIPYGLYIAMDEEPDEDTMNMAKEELAYELSKALIKSNMVQFIFKNPADNMNDLWTLGAKLYVVPWDKTIQYKKYVKITEDKEE